MLILVITIEGIVKINKALRVIKTDNYYPFNTTSNDTIAAIKTLTRYIM